MTGRSVVVGPLHWSDEGQKDLSDLGAGDWQAQKDLLWVTELPMLLSY